MIYSRSSIYIKKNPKLLLSLPCMATVAFATPLLKARGTAVLGIITFTLAECTGTEAAGSTQYFINDGPCKNVPPVPSTPLVPFLAFGTGFFPPKGQTCELQVFADVDCAGQHEGFTNPNIKCQNVGVALASQGVAGAAPSPKVGARSIKLTCVLTWCWMELDGASFFTILHSKVPNLVDQWLGEETHENPMQGWRSTTEVSMVSGTVKLRCRVGQIIFWAHSFRYFASKYLLISQSWPCLDLQDFLIPPNLFPRSNDRLGSSASLSTCSRIHIYIVWNYGRYMLQSRLDSFHQSLTTSDYRKIDYQPAETRPHDLGSFLLSPSSFFHFSIGLVFISKVRIRIQIRISPKKNI